MLEKSTKLEPDNMIYKMCYLGSLTDDNIQEYLETGEKAVPLVLKTFEGKGILNDHFREVLNR